MGVKLCQGCREVRFKNGMTWGAACISKTTPTLCSMPGISRSRDHQFTRNPGPVCRETGLLLSTLRNKLAQIIYSGHFMTYERPLITRCVECDGIILIQRETARPGHSLPCPTCGSLALICIIIDAARKNPVGRQSGAPAVMGVGQ